MDSRTLTVRNLKKIHEPMKAFQLDPVAISSLGCKGCLNKVKARRNC